MEAGIKHDVEIRFNRKTRIQYAYNNPRMVLKSNGSLLIRETQMDDSGQYRCVSENSSNSASHLFELLIISSKPAIQNSTEKADFADEMENSVTESDSFDPDFEILIPSWRLSPTPDIEFKKHSELMKDITEIEERLSKNTNKGDLKTHDNKENPVESETLLGLIISGTILVAVILAISLIILGMLCTLFLQ